MSQDPVIITMNGGLIQSIHTPVPVVVIDYDRDEVAANEDDAVPVPQGSLDPHPAIVTTWPKRLSFVPEIVEFARNHLKEAR